MTGPEFDLCVTIKEWMDLTYPNILYRFDLGGICVSQGLANKIKKLQQGRGWPDLLIAEPVLLECHHCGLFIEIKTSVDEVYRKDGKFKKKIKKIYKQGFLMEKRDHIQEQLSMLLELRQRGYKAVWGFGYNHIINQITNYLKGKQSVTKN